ncbi:MAG TPA: L-2-amino-thiazoline-4-carboxylic acid hydrolase [Blastocatellia bacterium]|nr:L-2-amino-thiazoline-4-carboxylic acid hydrolase [Blastocatellia bacterium]
MTMLSSLLLLTPSLAFRHAAQKHLAASALANDRARIWQRAISLQAELRKTRPHHSFGVDHFLRFMEWDNALYRAMQEHGMPPEQSRQMIEEINWEVFGSGTMTTFMLSRLRSSKLQTRIQWVSDLLFFALFTKPFRKQDVPLDNGIAFDVMRCPVAEYFHQQGIPELTRFAACNLDHRMAQQWGVKLERAQTIAAGDARCDFRFKIVTTEKDCQ